MWDWREVTPVILYFLSQQPEYNVLSSLVIILSSKDENIEVVVAPSL